MSDQPFLFHDESIALANAPVERVFAYKKVWETIGTPNLLVMAQYRMGFDLTRKGDSSRVRVFIDDSLPTNAPGSLLGRLLGGVYARWWTKQMANDAARHFNPKMA